MTLLEETIETLRDNHKNEKEVLFICGLNSGYKKVYMTWQQFCEISNIDYQEIGATVRNIFVVGNNWWLERSNDFNDNYWEYKECPSKPELNDYFDIFDFD